MPFVELDALVARHAGMSLPVIFEMHGEAHFRRLERDALRKFLAESDGAVLATSGSIVTDRETFALLRKHATTVWLRADPSDHLRRVVAQGDLRPMQGRPAAQPGARRLAPLAKAPLRAGGRDGRHVRPRHRTQHRAHRRRRHPLNTREGEEQEDQNPVALLCVGAAR